MHREEIQKMIYKIRGQQVMLDADLAQLYQVPTKSVNLAVRRNLIRFPPDFMFQLSPSEIANLRFQFETSSWGGRRYRPFAFTEQGIAMLSSVLRGERAALINIAIMRAFVRLRHAILSNQDVARRVEKLEGKIDVHDTDIRLLVQDVEQLKRKKLPDLPMGPPEVV